MNKRERDQTEKKGEDVVYFQEYRPRDRIFQKKKFQMEGTSFKNYGRGKVVSKK